MHIATFYFSGGNVLDMLGFHLNWIVQVVICCSFVIGSYINFFRGSLKIT